MGRVGVRKATGTARAAGTVIRAVARAVIRAVARVFWAGGDGRLGAGIAPVAALVHAGAPVGLGVDGAASNAAGGAGGELRHALLGRRVPGLDSVRPLSTARRQIQR